MRHATNEEIQDLADGRIDAARAQELREHLEVCDACSAELRGIEELKELAMGLAVGSDPPEGEWERIHARITGVTRPMPSRASGRVPAGGFFPLRRAAAWALLAVAAGGGAIVFGSGDGPAPAVEVAELGPAQSVDAAYAQSVYDLELIFEEGASQLSPETLAVIEENLAVIEEAVERARAEIEADPGSVALARSLDTLYGAKVRVLSAAVALADER